MCVKIIPLKLKSNDFMPLSNIQNLFCCKEKAGLCVCALETILIGLLVYFHHFDVFFLQQVSESELNKLLLMLKCGPFCAWWLKRYIFHQQQLKVASHLFCCMFCILQQTPEWRPSVLLKKDLCSVWSAIYVVCIMYIELRAVAWIAAYFTSA